MVVEPVLHVAGRVRGGRQDRRLIDDPVVEGRRLEEDDEGIALLAEGVEVAELRRVARSVVNTSAPSRSSASCRTDGRCRWAPSQSTANRTADSSWAVAVAKCSATSGEKVQSRHRVGSPWCCASAIQSQVVGPGAARWAYLRKLRIRWGSSDV
jgi:hypothetical protein